MIDAFVEGVRSIPQACHLVILLPSIVVVFAGRGRWPVVAGSLVGIVLGGWLFATRWLVLDDSAIRWSGLVIVGLIAAIWLVPSRLPDRVAPPATAGLAAVAGVTSTTWWRPCVGRELGDLLTRAPDAPWAQLPATTGFMLGISLPLAAAALVVAAVDPRDATRGRLAIGATGAGVVLAVAVIAGQHGEIVSTLFRWSEPFV